MLVGVILISACGATAAPAATPVVQTVEVEVTRVVQVEVTREVVVTATPKPATATPAATRTPAPTRTATPVPVGGKWEVEIETSSFDNSTTVYLGLEAEQVVEGAFESALPVLYLRCLESAPEVYIYLGLTPDVEMGNFDGATIRLRFDDEPAETVNAERSTDDKAVFFPRPQDMMDRLAETDTLLIGFTPFSSNPVETAFDTRGLAEVLPQLREVCPR
jgi:hypothetical protein